GPSVPTPCPPKACDELGGQGVAQPPARIWCNPPDRPSSVLSCWSLQPGSHLAFSSRYRSARCSGGFAARSRLETGGAALWLPGFVATLEKSASQAGLSHVLALLSQDCQRPKKLGNLRRGCREGVGTASCS